MCWPKIFFLAVFAILIIGEPQYGQPIYEDSSNFELSGPINFYDLNDNDRSRRNLDNSPQNVQMSSRNSRDSRESTKGRGDSCNGVYCHPNARCHNGRCHCEFGYEGDAKHHCDKVDLCKKLGCHAFARCHDGRCRCDSGYSGDGYRECIRADSAGSAKGISLSEVTTVAPEIDPSVKGKGQQPAPQFTKGQSASSEKSRIAKVEDLISESNSTDPDMFVGLPYSIDLLSFMPHPPTGDEFSNVYSTDGGTSWINYNSPRRPLPAPLPIRTVFPTSYMPRELIHPISFMVDFAPYERSRPGRSFLISRVDRHGRLRFAVALNQWGSHGEYMELWIHHDNFFTARYDPVMGLQYSGGLMPSTGIATIPLPRAEPGTQKSIKISLEMSDRDLQVFNGCPRDENRIFSLYYSPRQEMNLGKGPSPPPVSAKGKGQTDNNPQTNDFTQDKIYLLSGGPVHNNRYKGLVRDMKLFFSRDGASRHCNFRLNEQPDNSNGKAAQNLVAPDGKGNSYDSSPMMPRSIPSSQPSYYPPSNTPSQFMGLNFDQSSSGKGGSRSELCVRVNPMKGDSVRLVKIPCN